MEHLMGLSGGIALILAVMAILALVETALAFRPRTRPIGANLALTMLTLALNFGLSLAAALAIDARGVGLLADLELPLLALFPIGVIALDLSTWVAHWLMHHVPFLWRAHRVHHSDTFVDVTTSLRQHPIEGLLRFAFVLGPAIALGLPFEVVAAYRVISALNGLVEHMNVTLWPPLDRALSWIVVTPSFHKLHHSKRRAETDTNYGNLFSIFDRVFRTFTPTDRAAHVEYGLEGHEDERLIALLTAPAKR